jgi:glucosamine-phosphate N-acetyltransferase
MINNKKYIIRKIEKNDYNNNLLKVLNQLSPINTNIINLCDFNLYIDSLNKNHLIFVIEDIESHLIIGTGTIVIEQKIIHNFGKVAHIEDIVIDSQHRGNNLGKYLLEFLVNKANELFCYKVILDCSDEHIFFYEKCNFIKKGNQMSIYF